MSIDLKTLVAKLERPVRAALERAAQSCLRQTHFEVEIEHLLLEMLDIEGGDLACVLPHFNLERDVVIAEIRSALEQFKRGNTRTPAFSRNVVLLLQDALVQSTIVLRQPLAGSGTMLLAMLENEGMCAQLSASVPSILRVSRAALFHAREHPVVDGVRDPARDVTALDHHGSVGVDEGDLARTEGTRCMRRRALIAN